MTQHLFTGDGAPTSALLAETGSHYTDNLSGDQYLAQAVRAEVGGPITETFWSRMEKATDEGGAYVEGAAIISVYPQGSSKPLPYTIWEPIATPHLVLPNLAGYPDAEQITAFDYLLTVSAPANGLIIENVASTILCSETLTEIVETPGSYTMSLPSESVMLQLRRLDAGPWVLMVHSLPGSVVI